MRKHTIHIDHPACFKVTEFLNHYYPNRAEWNEGNRGGLWFHCSQPMVNIIHAFASGYTAAKDPTVKKTPTGK